MSNAMKYIFIQVLSWTLVAIGMIVIFLIPDTINNWGDNRTKTLLLALLFVFGFGVDSILRIVEKTKKWDIRRDERDESIQHQSLRLSFVLLIIYIFIISIALYIKYEIVGAMPVGWVWFIAYSTIVFANLSAGYTSLYLYKKNGR